MASGVVKQMQTRWRMAGMATITSIVASPTLDDGSSRFYFYLVQYLFCGVSLALDQTEATLALDEFPIYQMTLECNMMDTDDYRNN